MPSAAVGISVLAAVVGSRRPVLAVVASVPGTTGQRQCLGAARA